MSRHAVSYVIGTLAVLAWFAYGVAAFVVEQKLQTFYGHPELPTGEQRWNPGIYADGAGPWLRRDRFLSRWEKRTWLGIFIGACALASAVLHH